jgi:hypothetical protein
VATWRDEFRTTIMQLVGRVPYEWGGQDPFHPEEPSADCSGLTIALLQRLGKLPLVDSTGHQWDAPAQGIARYFEAKAGVEDVATGDLVFYGRAWDRVVHVMFWLGPLVLPAGERVTTAVVGMCGGQRGMTAAKARLIGANCWVRLAATYRGDLLGFKKVP